MLTDIIPPPAPTTGINYSIFALSDLIINLSSPGFVQTPACGYTLTESITWTLPNFSPIVVDTSNKYKITVRSTRNLDDKVYPLIIRNTVSYLNSAGQTQNWTPQQSFSVTITDPCLTTVITDFTLDNITIKCGETKTVDFNWPTDSAALAVNSPDICGTRTYTLTEVISGADVA